MLVNFEIAERVLTVQFRIQIPIVSRVYPRPRFANLIPEFDQRRPITLLEC